MVRLNVSLIIEKDENRHPLKEAVVELIELSLREKGCIDYDLFGSVINNDRMLIYETWEDRAALKSHMESDHFKRLVPRIQELATMTLEEFDF
ncbi:MAG: antibiotic biosynthesis monooxygenase [Bacteroides sp.]|nr:antibiotic biosynthesis monooxygenase [Bacteroidales bacterium]MBD5316212.1 antibiotic biosynthesis monooxygenase [Bacteroides sp.]MBD5377822.1 antibiotic biosynthesis monooxygenase [Bacteroides sp.]